MEVAGTSQVAGAPVPGGPSFTRGVKACLPLLLHLSSFAAASRAPAAAAMRHQTLVSAVPSSVGTDVSWDEMGQLGLHKALNEYYKASQGDHGRQRAADMTLGVAPAGWLPASRPYVDRHPFPPNHALPAAVRQQPQPSDVRHAQGGSSPAVPAV